MAKWREVKKGKVPKQSKQDISHNQTLTSPSASIPSRLKAFLTDTFLITTPIFYLVIYFLMGGGEEFAQNRSVGWGLIFLFHFIIIAFFWLKNSQTPGLKAYSLKLRSKNETPLTFIQIVVRYIVTLLSVVSIFLLLIPFFREDKQTLQDILSNTYITLE